MSMLCRCSPVIALGASASMLIGAGASEIGHQGGGSFNPGDHFAPPKALIFSLYGNGYATTALRDGSGDEISGFDLSGHTVDLDIDVQSLQIIPMIVWSPGVKVLGGDLSTLIMPIYGQTSISADLSAFGRRIQIDEDAWGMQDSYVQPLWLTWRTAHWDLSAAYGIWAPTGSYDPDALDNTGAGFWSHLLRASAGWSPDGLRGTLLSASLAYELNSEKDGLDLTPGAHLILDAGIKHALTASFEAGIYGFGQWQVTDDSGRDAADPGTHDRLYGVGAYGSYWLLPMRLSILARGTVEFGARDRFEGRSAALGLNLIF